MANNKKQISVRLPPNIYNSLTDFLRHSELTQTQVTTYAIAHFIGCEKAIMNTQTTDNYSQVADDPRANLELDDLKLDVEDVTNFVEKLDYRLSRIEEILKAHRKIKNTLTETEKKIVQDFLSNKENELFQLKELIIYLNWNPENRSSQINVSKYLKRIGYKKKRRKIDGKHLTFWGKYDE